MTEYKTHAALVQSLEAEVSRLLAINAELRARESTSLRQRADAWMAVCALLRELRPSWQEGPGSAQEQALEAIRAMAAQPIAAEAEQEPVAWAIRYDGKTPYTLWHKGQDAVLDLEVQRLGGSDCKMALYTAPQQGPMNLSCKSTQARLATLWGYVKADADVLEPSYTVVELAKMVLSDCGFSPDYTPLLDRVSVRIEAHVQMRLEEFRECIEKAPQPARQPLTADEIEQCCYAADSESKYLPAKGGVAMPRLDQCPHLSPCPFCGAALDARWDRFNPFARCRTAGCMAQSLPVLCLDDPEAVERWNKRATVSPLTDAEICAIFIRLDPLFWDAPTGFELDFARAIEHAHGIGDGV